MRGVEAATGARSVNKCRGASGSCRKERTRKCRKNRTVWARLRGSTKNSKNIRVNVGMSPFRNASKPRQRFKFMSVLLARGRPEGLRVGWRICLHPLTYVCCIIQLPYSTVSVPGLTIEAPSCIVVSSFGQRGAGKYVQYHDIFFCGASLLTYIR